MLLSHAAGRHSTLSGGGSPYLKQLQQYDTVITNTLASVEPPGPYTQKGECGQVSCGLSLFSGFLAARQDY